VPPSFPDHAPVSVDESVGSSVAQAIADRSMTLASAAELGE